MLLVGTHLFLAQLGELLLGGGSDLLSQGVVASVQRVEVGLAQPPVPTQARGVGPELLGADILTDAFLLLDLLLDAEGGVGAGKPL